mmetsp:Transcript_35944/g.99007  ORF Transcript_35944/g.99007 Transcript_35944/m.99007 type:complete len:410 (-) Transcript_35944:120-1349(-)
MAQGVGSFVGSSVCLCARATFADSCLAMWGRANRKLSNSTGYTELADVRTEGPSRQWWRAASTAASSEEHASLAFASVRPSELILNAMELTSDGLFKHVAVSREELFATTAITPEEFRALLLVGLSAATEHFPLQCDGSCTGSTYRKLRTFSSAACFTLRDGALILNLGGIRALVDERRVLVFDRNEDTTAFLSMLRQGPSPAKGKFLLRCAECALLTIIRRLDVGMRKVREVSEPVTNRSLNIVRLREMELERVRQQRLTLLNCAGQAAKVGSAVSESLNTQPLPLSTFDAAETQEWVTMMELYLQAYGEFSDECATLLAVIDNFEESSTLAMQVRRLHIEEFELSLLIAAFSVAVSALVPGAMGMNLKNGYEESDKAFMLAVVSTIIVIVTLFTLIRCFAACRGIFN